ncbi:MAG: TatD family hydrolase, partial [Bacilli bacterium]
HMKTSGIMHCFSGSVETAKIVLDLGMYISFAGPLTFKNARGLTDVPPIVPMNRIFVETDAPYLTPHPLRGQQNEPKNVVHTFKKVCELKGVGEEEAKQAMKENYERLFKK